MARKHHHKYHKVAVSNGTLFCCTIEGCNHFMPKHLEGTLIGRTALCYDCEMPFKIVSLNDNQLRCNDCKYGQGIESILDSEIGEKQ